MKQNTIQTDTQGNELNPVLAVVDFHELLKNWDTAIVDLYRNKGMFRYTNVRLRNCTLSYSETINQYFVRYNDVTFSQTDIYNYR